MPEDELEWFYTLEIEISVDLVDVQIDNGAKLLTEELRRRLATLVAEYSKHHIHTSYKLRREILAYDYDPPQESYDAAYALLEGRVENG